MNPSVPTLSARRVRRELIAKVAIVVGGVLLANAVMAGWLTRLEASWSAWLMTRLGVDGLQALSNQSLVLVDHQAGPFAARVSPSCSSLTSVVALTALSTVLLGGSWRRRVVAALIASTVVLVGNLARIGVVLWMGTERGVQALVLFHDWVGTMFSVCYTMIGFLALLALRLPSKRRWADQPPLTFGL
jgi:exosortase/archaeosortase family protein